MSAVCLRLVEWRAMDKKAEKWRALVRDRLEVIAIEKEVG